MLNRIVSQHCDLTNGEVPFISPTAKFGPVTYLISFVVERDISLELLIEIYVGLVSDFDNSHLGFSISLIFVNINTKKL
jgi:hypothetical protein